MKKSVFFLLFLPFLLSAQNQTPSKWRFNFDYQFENIRAFNNGVSYPLDAYGIEKEPAIGHSIQIGFANYRSAKTGFQYGLRFANRNVTLITRHNGLGGVTGSTEVLASFERIFFAPPILVKTNQINIEANASFFWEKQFKKFGLILNGGLGLNYFADYKIQKATEIDSFSLNYGKEVEIDGDFKPDWVIPFLKIQVGIFYHISEPARIFLQPNFRMDLIKTRSDLLKHRFWAMGAVFGFSLEV